MSFQEKPTQSRTQETVFLGGEGDAWFKRNEGALSNKTAFPEFDELLGWLNALERKTGHMLEVGCSNGSKLDFLSKSLSLKGHGIEPSEKAVDSGRATFPELELNVGTASALPFEAAFFDYVHFGFSLYLVDRSKLFTALSEADRVLRPGGFLSVLDFHPRFAHQTPYAHAPGLSSYKQRYYEPFLATGAYSLVGFRSMSHQGQQFHPDQRERVGVALLYKEIEPFPEVTLG